MSFEKLIADMEIMAKSIPQTDDKDQDPGEEQDLDKDGDQDDAEIQAAADESDTDQDGDDQPGDADPEPAEKEGDGEMAKSFSFTLEDGTQVDAVDGTEMIKSLTERFDADTGVMLKALGLTVDMLKAQATQIVAMGARITKLSGEGRNRKSVLSVSEKSTPAAGVLQKSQPEGLSHKEFFAKANAAQLAGRITASEIGLAETCLNSRTAIPAHIISRVMG
jgi:hypothetical protein